MPAGGGSGIEDPRDIGVIHQGEGLALGLEAADDGFGVHARLEDFEGDPTADGFALFGHENHAATAFADLFEQFVATDHIAGGVARRQGGIRHKKDADGAGGLGVEDGGVEAGVLGEVSGEQLADGFAQAGIVGAGGVLSESGKDSVWLDRYLDFARRHPRSDLVSDLEPVARERAERLGRSAEIAPLDALLAIVRASESGVEAAKREGG